MNRLTKRDEYDGEAYFPNWSQRPRTYLGEVCEKLASYEDTGLTPEQIREIDKLYAEKCRELTDERKKHEWIPCSERLPEDGDDRFYMCIAENHEEDPPMFCQYEEEYGFGFWHDIYDEETLGFVDSEFKTNEELGYEKVIAWQPLPEPYNPERSGK